MRWWSRLLGRGSNDADLDEEIRFHLEQEASLRVDRGDSVEQARRRARRDFGNVTLMRETMRDTWRWLLLDDLARDARHACRLLLRAPAFSAVAALSLAIGIGANTAIFTVVHAVLLRPLPYPEPGRLIAIDQRYKDGSLEFATWPDYGDWRRAGSLAAAGGAWSAVYNLTGIDEPERLAGAAVTASLFSALGVEPAIGRAFVEGPGQDVRVVVLSHRLWQRRFGGAPDVVGRRVELNGQPYSVAGVMPAGFAWPETAELWVPFVPQESMNRGYHLLRVVGRLARGATVATANAELTTIAADAARAYPATNKDWGVQASSLLESTVGSTARSLLILSGAVACVLLIACANVTSLLASRAVVRRHEMALRSALGATRRRLVRQLVTESVLLSLVGGAIGLGLALAAIDPLLALTTLPRASEVSLDANVLFVTLIASIGTGLVVGVVSAIAGSRTDLRNGLAGRGSTPTGWLRPVLLIVQVAAAVVLLAGAGLLLASFYRLHQVEPGFKPEGLLTARFFLPRASYPAERCARLYEQMIDRVKALPGVETAAAVSAFPFSSAIANVAFEIAGRPPVAPGQGLTANFAAATPGYFRTAGIGLIAGRDFEPADTAGTPFVAVINRAAADRFFPGQDPIGQAVKIIGPKPRTIVGIVQDIRQRSLDRPPQAEVYVPHAQFPSGGMFLVVRAQTGEPEGLAAAVRAEVRALDRNLAMAATRTARQILDDTLSSRRFSLVLLSIFGATALVLSIVGVYGVVSLTVSQRTREIGIRKALGAARRDVFGLLVWHGMWPVAAGLVVGVSAAFAATRLLANMLFEVRPSDPVTLGGVVVLLLAAAFLAVLIPARRAARIDPLIALQ
jgi:putative ABC transport system permease protein